ncbi:hypothetical protein [Hafnia phage yong3]|nr:hypothetical protein [Hafnia phage yong3]
MKHNPDLTEIFIEYMDILVTLKIAVALANKERRPVNRTIRASWAAIRKRVHYDMCLKIFDGVVKQPFPDGALKMQRRHLDTVASEK